jgi:hypothetical protein
MSTFGVVARVYRARVALLVLAVAAAYGTAHTAALPHFAVWPPQVEAVGEALYAASFGATAAAALLALPRAEAAEVTASRPQWAVRLLVAGGLYLALAVVAALVCVAAGTAWYLGPLVRVAVTAAAVTFALAAVLPPAYVTVAVIVYVLFCAFGSQGWAWWDLVFAEPSPARWVAAVVIAVAGTAVYAAVGARPLPPEDEY